MLSMTPTYQPLASQAKESGKCRVKSSSRTLDLPATIEANLSYSGFYCTLDLEQNAELRISSNCYSDPKFNFSEVELNPQNGEGIYLVLPLQLRELG